MSDEVRTTSASGGQKGVKLARYDLIPKGPLHQYAEHLGRGAEKYEEHNWRRGYEWSKSFAALQRHVWAFWGGEDIDEETGSHHLAAVIFHAMAMLEWVDTHPEFDDRWRPDDAADGSSIIWGDPALPTAADVEALADAIRRDLAQASSSLEEAWLRRREALDGDSLTDALLENMNRYLNHG